MCKEHSTHRLVFFHRTLVSKQRKEEKGLRELPCYQHLPPSRTEPFVSFPCPPYSIGVDSDSPLSWFLLLAAKGKHVWVQIGGSHSTLDSFTLSACPRTAPTLLRPTSWIFSFLDDYQLRFRRCLAYCATTFFLFLFLTQQRAPPPFEKQKQTENWNKQCLPATQ